MTPEELKELNAECIREQTEWLATQDAANRQGVETQGELREDGRDREIRGEMGTEKVEQAELEEVTGYGDDGTHTPAYHYEQELRDTAEVYGMAYEPPAVAASLNNGATALEFEQPLTEHEPRFANTEWAADHRERPDLQEGTATGMYANATYPPPPLPTSFCPPQPPNSSFRPFPNHF